MNWTFLNLYSKVTFFSFLQIRGSFSYLFFNAANITFTVLKERNYFSKQLLNCCFDSFPNLTNLIIDVFNRNRFTKLGILKRSSCTSNRQIYELFITVLIDQFW